MSNTIPERPEDVRELFRLYDGPCDWDELAEAADCGDLIDYARSAKEHIAELETRIAELGALVQQSLSCITQGRVAFDDEQDMTDWYVAAAELQARLEAALTTEAQHDTTGEVEV